MNNRQLQVAIYARVSSEQQVNVQSIDSQLAALQQRVTADGVPLNPELQFIDDGYSGSTLVRPALERLRDLVALGGVDRLYVHSPDRLSADCLAAAYEQIVPIVCRSTVDISPHNKTKSAPIIPEAGGMSG